MIDDIENDKDKIKNPLRILFTTLVVEEDNYSKTLETCGLDYRLIKSGGNKKFLLIWNNAYFYLDFIAIALKLNKNRNNKDVFIGKYNGDNYDIDYYNLKDNKFSLREKYNVNSVKDSLIKFIKIIGGDKRYIKVNEEISVINGATSESLIGAYIRNARVKDILGFDVKCNVQDILDKI